MLDVLELDDENGHPVAQFLRPLHVAGHLGHVLVHVHGPRPFQIGHLLVVDGLHVVQFHLHHGDHARVVHVELGVDQRPGQETAEDADHLWKHIRKCSVLDRLVFKRGNKSHHHH